MPESPLCDVCDDVVEESQDYVIPNKNADRKSWVYRHKGCHKKKRGTEDETSPLDSAAVVS